MIDRGGEPRPASKEFEEDGPYTMGEEFALYRAMVGDEVHQVPVVDDQCDGRVWNLSGPSEDAEELPAWEQCDQPIYCSDSAPERCAYAKGHEGKCEP